MLEIELFQRAIAPATDRPTAPRALLLFAHPDDEVIALGARLRRFADARIVHATDGAPQDQQDSRAHGFSSLEAYRQARVSEVRRALLLAGLEAPPECLGIPDQQAALQLCELTEGIVRILTDFAPRVIFTHPYEGGHPDHDACALAVARAVDLATVAPLVIEAAFYHAGPGGFEAGTFLAPPHPTPHADLCLAPAEVAEKQRLLDCFPSQRDTLRNFPLDYERYRVAPRYDFSRPPHPGRPLYELHPWGMTGPRFLELASQAMACA